MKRMTSPFARWATQALGALLFTLSAAASALAGTAYSVVTLSMPGTNVTELSGINDSGTIVGSFAGGADGLTRFGFVYRDSAFTTVPGPAGALSSAVRGISNSGLMIGNFASGGLGLQQQSFLYDGSSYTVLTLPFGQGAARSISPNGRYVVGDVFGNSAGFVHDLLTGQTQTFGTGGFIIVAQGVNDQGQVVGSRTTATPGAAPVTRPFVFEVGSGAFTENPDSYPGLVEARPRAINNDGVIGGYTVSSGAFVRDGDQIFSLGLGSAYFSTVSALNGLGVAVGYTRADATPNSFSAGFIATPVPEPASLGLFLLGGAGLLVLLRHRARAAA